MKSKLEQWRDSSAVIRFHVLRQIKHQTVGQHSHGVACLVMLVYPECSATLLKAALTHDFHEQHIGDMPSNAKRMFPEVAKAVNDAGDEWDRQNKLDWAITEHERRVLKFCDYFELLLWSKEEYDMGNTYARVPLINICKWLDDMAIPTPEAAMQYLVARKQVEVRLGNLYELYKKEEIVT